MTAELRRKAEALRALHRPGRPLLLVNVWDAATARVVEAAGFPAIATSSAGIAFARGYPDGERITRDEMLEEVASVCRAVSVPVTADLEAAYGDSPMEVAATVAGALDAGAVGMNLEDGTGDAAQPLADLSLQLEKIHAVGQTAAARGVPFVLNARTDVYLRGVGDSAGWRLRETLRRGAAYRDAGAACVFVPGVADAGVIRTLVSELGCPVNVLSGAGSPTVNELALAGVARISLGSSPMRAAVTLVQRLAQELASHGTYSKLEGLISHGEMNELMERR